ncbi:MAG: 50S ribosomal protein L25/general stress protein Ctc [Chlamydiales bacterium]
MKLAVTNRISGKKSETKKIRSEGNIPAILYAQGKAKKEIIVDGIEFKKILNSLDTGMLSSTVFTLTFDNNEVHAILKDVQYHITTGQVIHLDFQELLEDVAVTLNIPIKCVNAVDCLGVKLGGVLRQVIRDLKVVCLPKDIPSHFELDVQELSLGKALRLNNIEIPNEVRPIANLKEVAVVVSKR